MVKIDSAISQEMAETPEAVKDQIDSIKLRIKEKKDLLA